MAGVHAGIVGNECEKLALAYLCRRGLRLVCRNFRCRFGEIDLVMRDDTVLVLVEVRYRGPGQYASAAMSVDTGKQRRLILAGSMFLTGAPEYADYPVRFDVVALDGSAHQEHTILWLRDAFRPPA